MVAEYEVLGDSFAPGRPHRWSDLQIQRPADFIRNFGLAPDGRRFAVIPRPDEAASKASLHVNFLLNFFDELRRRIPEAE